MTDDTTPTRQAIAAEGRSGKLIVSGRLKVALDLMLEGSRRDVAATAAGLKPHSLREALKKAHVRSYWKRGLLELRESEQARSIFRIVELRDQDDNKMVAFNAAKELASGADGDDVRNPFADHTSGLTIIIQQPAAAPARMVDITPLKPDDAGR